MLVKVFALTGSHVPTWWKPSSHPSSQPDQYGCLNTAKDTHKNVTHSQKHDEVRAPEVSHTANIYSLVISRCYLPYVVCVVRVSD
jgi:hypothetical protein